MILLRIYSNTHAKPFASIIFINKYCWFSHSMRFHLHIHYTHLEISSHSECHYSQRAKEKERQKISKKFLRSIKNSVDLKRKIESYIDERWAWEYKWKTKAKEKEESTRKKRYISELESNIEDDGRRDKCCFFAFETSPNFQNIFPINTEFQEEKRMKNIQESEMYVGLRWLWIDASIDNDRQIENL